MAARATAVLAGEGPLLLAGLVFAECAYVLESFYEGEPARVAELMRAAIALPSIETVATSVLMRALEMYELDRLDFAEAYLVAQVESTGSARSSCSIGRPTGSRGQPALSRERTPSSLAEGAPHLWHPVEYCLWRRRAPYPVGLRCSRLPMPAPSGNK
jgi:hypothetical protein